MKKTTKKLGLKTETSLNLAQDEIRTLADEALHAIAGGGYTFICHSNPCSFSYRCI